MRFFLLYFSIFANLAYAQGDQIFGYPPANGAATFSSQGGLCIQTHPVYTPDMQNCWNSPGSGTAESGVLGCPVKQCTDGNCDGSSPNEYMTRWTKKTPFPTGCVDPTPAPCPPTGTLKSNGMYNLGTNENASIPNVACDGGCITIYSGEGITKRATINGVYNYFYGSGSYNYNGESCTTGQASPGSQTTVPPNTCNPDTQQKGEVNGATVCLPKSQSNNTNTTTSPPVTDPATGNTTTTTNTTINNTVNNTTTNITTTTTTAPDGTKSETKTETTTKNPPTNFCQQNPTDPTCLKNSQVCEDNPEILGCKTLGTVEDGIVGTAEQGISSITPKSIGGSGSCPAPITTSFMGRTITFSYDLPCQAAGMLKPLILALAWLGAGIIFIGGVRQ